jgi:hypothetical protein
MKKRTKRQILKNKFSMELFLCRPNLSNISDVVVDNIVNILGKFILEQTTKPQRGNKTNLFLTSALDVGG